MGERGGERKELTTERHEIGEGEGERDGGARERERGERKRTVDSTAGGQVRLR